MAEAADPTATDRPAVRIRGEAAGTPPRTAAKAGASVPLQITGRDLEILRAVHRYRYLRTGQVKRLLFPESSTLQSARRRLRKLAHPAWRYLVRIGRAGQAGETVPEAAYSLGLAGAALLESCGDELIPYPRSRGNEHLFLEHALAISEFRLALELGLQAEPDISLQRFVHEEELKTHLRRRVSKDAYKLFHRLTHPRSGQEYVVHPDALLVLAAGEDAAARRLYFLEIDRGSESLRRIADDKVPGYRLLKESGAFRKFGDFASFLVLLVTNSERRADNLRKVITDMPGEADIWIAADTQISKHTVLTEAVWRDQEGRRQAILR